jgi:hypothetical protein
VLTDIARIDSNYAKGLYYRQLFRQAIADAGPVPAGDGTGRPRDEVVVVRARQLLIAIADQIPADEASRAAYFQRPADFIRLRAAPRLLDDAEAGPGVAGHPLRILQSARSMDSNYELSELLRQIAAQQDLDAQNRAAFFGLVGAMNSDYERHRVLSAAVGGTRQVSADTMKAALEAARFSSDYEASQFLQEILKRSNVESSLSASVLPGRANISSNYEKGRVLQAVVRKSGTGADTLRAVLQAAQAGEAMNGYELSQLAPGDRREPRDQRRRARGVPAAADRLGDYEQGQAMAALVRSERRR